MKKVILILLVVFLGSCTLIKNDRDDSELYKNKDNYQENDISIIMDTDHHLDDFKTVSKWFSENLDYISNINKQNIHLNGNSEGYLRLDNIYLLKGDHQISYELKADGDYDLYFEIYDDNGNLYTSNLMDGNTISIKLDKVLYSASLRYRLVSRSDTNIEINNFKIMQPKDINNIHINQIGYLNDNRKIAFFDKNHGDYYEIINYDTNESMGIYGISEAIYSETTKDYTSMGDFTSFNQDGTYYLLSSLGFKSYPFKINSNIYYELSKDVLRMLTIQRCNEEIPDTLSLAMAHDKCHDENGHLYYGSRNEFDVRGGWHDAGDYGRYVDTGIKAVTDLLLAYISNPNAYKDDENILDENNQIPDILDEAKYELDWLLKMQNSSGGVYSRATTMNFAPTILPDEDHETMYITEISTASTAGFSGVMALASTIYTNIDQEYATKCLNSAKLAYDYVKNNQEYNKPNPHEFNTGEYPLEEELNYHYFMSMALWYATGDNNYLNYAHSLDLDLNKLYSGIWSSMIAYGEYIFLLKADEKVTKYQEIKDIFMSYADGLVEISRKDPYHNTLGGYYIWGSNQHVADRSMILMMAYKLFDKLEYYDVASEQINYLLGANALNLSFITGYGSEYPHNIHHRITIKNKSESIGFLVGGPNGTMDDEILQKKFRGADIGKAKIYIDHQDSYSSNEVAIYYNTPLLFSLGFLK